MVTFIKHCDAIQYHSVVADCYLDEMEKYMVPNISGLSVVPRNSSRTLQMHKLKSTLKADVLEECNCCYILLKEGIRRSVRLVNCASNKMFISGLVRYSCSVLTSDVHLMQSAYCNMLCTGGASCCWQQLAPAAVLYPQSSGKWNNRCKLCLCLKMY